MFISPIKAIEEKWITGVEDQNLIQPNAIDITADRIFKINASNVFSLSKNGKTHRNRSELTNPNTWRLDPGVYDIMSNCYVEMPAGVAGYLITRSTLNRNGTFILSGLYDSGYKGPIQCVLYNLFSKTYLEPHVPVAQFIFVESHNHGKYLGGYNTTKGILPDYILKQDKE